MTRIEEIEAREKAATGGPWEDVRLADEPDVAIMSSGTVLAEMGDFFPEAKFVAHAREDIPYLLAQLREAREEKAEALELAEHFNDESCAHANERDEARGKLKVLDAWREANHICPVDYCCWSAALAGLDRILHPKEAE